MSALLLVHQGSRADFTRDESKGEVFSAAEWTRLCTVVNCMVQLDLPCADEIACLKDNDRTKSQICREGNPKATWMGITNTDATLGKSKGDGINLHPRPFKDAPKWVIIMTLVHEWVHVEETTNGRRPGNPFDPNTQPYSHWWFHEENAYNREKQVLCQLIANAPEGEEKEQMKKWKEFFESWLAALLWNAALEQGSQGPCLPVPEGCPTDVTAGHLDVGTVLYAMGPDKDGTGNASLGCFYCEDGVAVSHRVKQLPFAATQSMTVVRDAQLPNGGWGLIVTGTNSNGNTGFIVGLETLNEDVLDTTYVLTQADFWPTQAVFDDDNDRLFILDTLNHEVRILSDSNGDGLPDTLETTPYATAIQFPFLADAKSIVLDVQSEEGDIRVSRQAVAPGHIFFYDDVQHRLLDSDDDGRADTASTVRYKDGLVFLPTFHGDLLDGQTEVDIHASWGAVIEVRDATGTVLGQGVADFESEETPTLAKVTLNRPLEEGETVLVDDLTHSFPMPPRDGVVLPNGG